MTVRPIAEAEKVFTKYSEGIFACVQEAISKYYLKFGKGLSHLETSTKRGMVRDLIVEELQTYAEKTSGVQFFKKGNLKFIGFDNSWYLRVKHINEKFRVGVSPTKDSRSYDRNIVPDKIAGNITGAAPTALYLGWHTTDNAPLDPQVSLVCNNENGSVEWVIAIAGEGLPPVFELLTPETSGEAGTRVRVRKTTKTTEING